MGWVVKGRCSAIGGGVFRSIPGNVPTRARIGARNPFISIGIPTADHRFYPAAPVVPFQGNTGSGIGLAGGLGRGLDEDGGCGVGADPGGWSTCGATLLSTPLRSLWRWGNRIRYG